MIERTNEKIHDTTHKTKRSLITYTSDSTLFRTEDATTKRKMPQDFPRIDETADNIFPLRTTQNTKPITRNENIYLPVRTRHAGIKETVFRPSSQNKKQPLPKIQLKVNLQERSETNSNQSKRPTEGLAGNRNSSVGFLIVSSTGRAAGLHTTGSNTTTSIDTVTTCRDRGLGNILDSLDSLVRDGLALGVVDIVSGSHSDTGEREEFALDKGLLGHATVDVLLAESEREGQVAVNVLETARDRTVDRAGGVSGGRRDLGLRRSVGEGGNERVILAHDVCGVIIELDETILVGLFGEFVDETTSEDTSHVLGVKSADLLPDTGTNLVATILGEEDGERVGFVVLDELVVAGSLEGVLTTPLITNQ